jgi:hypothetical protein
MNFLFLKQSKMSFLPPEYLYLETLLSQDDLYQVYFVVNSDLSETVKDSYLQGVATGKKDTFLDNPLLLKQQLNFQTTFDIQRTEADSTENENFKCSCGSTKGKRNVLSGAVRADEIQPIEYNCFVCGNRWVIR